MNIHQTSILLITIICSFYVYSVQGIYDFHRLERTWIVRNTSNVYEKDNCPFVLIYNATRNGTAELRYTADNHQDTLATLKDTNGTIKLSTDKVVRGNFDILKDNVPYYMLIRINTTIKDLPPYLVLTGVYQLPVEIEREITQFWNTNNATRNVSLYSTQHERNTCEQFLLSSGIPQVPPLYFNGTVIATGTTSSIPKPVIGGSNNGTTQKPPKNASSSLSSNFLFTVIFFSFVFLFEKIH